VAIIIGETVALADELSWFETQIQEQEHEAAHLAFV
jgi:hypothetical protein